MRIGLVVIVALFYNIRVVSSQNLVPNPSFEEYVQCPDALADYDEYVSNWFNCTLGTADYYNACATTSSNVAVPENLFGFQQPRTGNAYSGITTYFDEGFREYMGVELETTLLQDTIYCVEFYVARGNLHNVSTSDLGLYFSSDSVFVPTGYELGYDPQIANDSNNFIVDTLNWTRISGEYTATGDEKFIVIGNFHSNSNTQIIGDTLPYPQNGSYYYIDDVSVTKCSQVTSINALAEPTPLQVYPNPASNEITVNSSNQTAQLQIVDAVGRVLKIVDTNSRQAVIDVSYFPNGIYFLKQVDTTTGVATQTKLVVMR